jgi:hypothetical protein
MPLGGRPFGKAPFGGTGAAPVAAASLVLQVAGIDVTGQVEWPALRHRKQLNGRDELSVTLLSSTGVIPALGAPVRMTLQNGLLFAGQIHERDIDFVTERNGQVTRSQVRCVDHNAIADRRRVVEVYEQKTAGEIVQLIMVKYLADEGVRFGDIQSGPLVTRMVIPYLTAAECLDELCERSGFFWNIDAHLVLNFFARTTVPAPFTIDSSNAVFRRIRGSRTKNQYRNVQYVDGGHGVTDLRTEPFRGDGTLRSFHVEYPLFKAPTITRNFAPQTVGIRGVDADKDWYWNAGETAIGQDARQEAIVLTDTDLLHVTYQGRFNLMQIVEDTSAVLERQGVEGGTGRYEQLDREDGLDGQDVVEEKGLALLRHFGSLDDVVEFETDAQGLDVGQLLTVAVPELGLDGQFLISDMEIEWINFFTRRFTVTATTGELKGRAEDFFTQFLGTKKDIAIREGEILQEVLAIHELVGVTDAISATLVDVAADEFGTGEFGPGEFGP